MASRNPIILVVTSQHPGWGVVPMEATEIDGMEKKQQKLMVDWLAIPVFRFFGRKIDRFFWDATDLEPYILLMEKPGYITWDV